MSARRKRRRRRRHPVRVIIVLAVIVLIVVLVYKYIYKPVKAKIASSVTDTVIEMQLKSDPELSAAADEILDSLDESDRAAVEDIVNSHMDAQTISKAAGYAASGDKEALLEYAQEILSDEEIAELEEIYEKYK